MSDREEIQQDTIDRLMIGRATEGDQLLAARALAALKARDEDAERYRVARELAHGTSGIYAVETASVNLPAIEGEFKSHAEMFDAAIDKARSKQHD